MRILSIKLPLLQALCSKMLFDLSWYSSLTACWSNNYQNNIKCGGILIWGPLHMALQPLRGKLVRTPNSYSAIELKRRRLNEVTGCDHFVADITVCRNIAFGLLSVNQILCHLPWTFFAEWFWMSCGFGYGWCNSYDQITTESCDMMDVCEFFSPVMVDLLWCFGRPFRLRAVHVL